MDDFKSYANVGIEGGIISPNSTTINQAIYDMRKYIKENAKQGYSVINIQCSKVNTLGLVDYYNFTVETNEPKTYTFTFTVTNGEKGDKGDIGYYIDNVTIDKISSQGLVDTYKISFHSTNEDTYEIEFNVTNGKSFNWMGEWIANNEYRENDVVYYNGSSYICKNDITGATTPDNDTANWSIMCKQGVQGEKGDTATIKVGEVTTLPAGSQATVENVGTNNNAVFNFGIPKGEKGDAGGLQVQEINYSANDDIITTALQIYNIAQTHNIVNVIPLFCGEIDVQYTTENNISYELANKQISVTQQGEMNISGYAFESENRTTMKSANIYVTPDFSVTYVDGENISAVSPNTNLKWTKSGSIYVYYQ